MKAPTAVFLDRDGVLIEDRGLLVDPAEIRILRGVPEALRRLKQRGFVLVMVTNQAVVARGLISEEELEAMNARMNRMLEDAGSPPLDAIYCCPHHPEATLARYRVNCTCRKPRPGMILRAIEEHGLDPRSSFLVGDRMTDIAAGAAGGCRTVLVRCGRHADPPIVTVDALDPACRADHTCDDLLGAVDWILRRP